MALEQTLKKREQLEQAIALQENLRGTIDDAIIDATISALRQQLKQLNEQDRPEHQRKQATVLFVDTVSSTEITRNLDPEENLELMGMALKKLTAPVQSYGGRVIRTMGDGYLAVFGVPAARENDPVLAVEAGLAALSAAEEFSRELQAKRKLASFQIRAGIHTGIIAISGSDDSMEISGATVNLAARLESAAPPGGLVISQQTYQQVRGIFDLQPLPPIEAKGFVEPVPIYQVLKAKERSFRTRSRGVEGIETRMIGREGEMKILQDAFFTMVEDGIQQMVTIVGDAGLGKSRLLYEFENWVDLQEATVTLFRGRARLEIQGSHYGLMRDLFSFRFGIQDDDPVQKVREKFVTGFGEVLDSPNSVEMMAHFSGQMLGYDFRDSPHLREIKDHPQQLRDRGLMYLTEYLIALSTQTPVLFLLEDLHWGDDSSLDLMNRVALRLDKRRIMIVGATRPSLYRRRSHWMEGQEFHRRLDLYPLAKRDSHRLVVEVLQKADEIPDDFRNLIVDNAAGNPFYVEELIKILIADGVIITDEQNWRIKPERIVGLHIPPTLTGVLQARLDNLPESQRKIIQQAAVVGRVFWDDVLGYLNQREDSELNRDAILDRLEALRNREMVFRREYSSVADAQEFIFKHAILREVTYESVLLSWRLIYHAGVAEWLRKESGDRAGEFTALIAEHLEKAGQQRDALAYLLQAAEDAADQFANEGALDYYDRALRLAETLRDRKKQAAIHWAMGKISSITGPYDKAVHHLEQARGLTQDSFTQAAIEADLGAAMVDQGDISGVDMLVAILPKFDPQKQVIEMAIALTSIGRFHHLQSNYFKAIDYFQQALELAEIAHDVPSLAQIYAYLAGSYQHLGQFSESLRWARTCIELGEREHYPVASAYGYEFEAEDFYSMGLWDDSLVASAMDYGLGKQLGSQTRMGWARMARGWALHYKGQLKAAEASLRESLNLANYVGDRRLELLASTCLVRNLTDQMRDKDAYRQLKHTGKLAREVNQYYLMATAFEEMSYYYTRQGDWEKARQLSQEAFDLYNGLTPGGLISPGIFLAHIFVAMGEIERAEQLLEEHWAHLEQAPLLLHLGLAHLTRGQIAVARNDIGIAEEEFTQAIEQFRETKTQLELGKALLHRCRFYSQVGKVAQALADVQGAMAIFEECDAPRDQQEARELLATLEES